MLTPKQRAYLKGLANPIKKRYLLGKGEMDGKFIDMVDKGLEANEIIKIGLLNTASSTCEDVCEEIVKALNAHKVSIIGRVITLYRPSKKNKKIVLPEK